VRSKKGVRSIGTDRTPEALIARVPGGKTGTRSATSSVRRGALPMSDAAAAVRYHLARPMSCDRWSESALQTLDDRLRHKRTVPLGFACGHRRGDRQLQHCGVLTFAQLGQ